MQTIVKRIGGGPKSLDAFADEHGLTLEISERSRTDRLPRYTAQFQGVEVGGDGMLRSAYGHGESPSEAIADYANNIAGRRLVVDAYGPKRRSFDAPNDFLAADADTEKSNMDPDLSDIAEEWD